MKLICKDYYKYSRFISTLVSIEQVFSLNSFERYYTIMDHFPLESILLYLKKSIKNRHKLVLNGGKRYKTVGNGGER